MARRGKDLENLVALLERHLGPQGVKVTSPDHIQGELSGSTREVDISLKGQLGSADILVIIECRDRGATEDVTWVEQLATKRNDVKANKAIAVSSSGFSAGAEKLAAALGIELRTIEEANPDIIGLWFDIREITIHHQRITLHRVDVPQDVLGSAPLRLGIDEKIFRRKTDGSQVSFRRILGTIDPMVLYRNIPLDGS